MKCCVRMKRQLIRDRRMNDRQCERVENILGDIIFKPVDNKISTEQIK